MGFYDIIVINVRHTGLVVDVSDVWMTLSILFIVKIISKKNRVLEENID